MSTTGVNGSSEFLYFRRNSPPEEDADSGADDPELQFLSQAFYPSLEPPSLDFLPPISSSTTTTFSPLPPPSSPPSRRMRTLSITKAEDTTTVAPESDTYGHESLLVAVKVEEEEEENPLLSSSPQAIMAESENAGGLMMMQRSFSSQCLDRPKPEGFLFHPRVSSLSESNGVGGGGLPSVRRACSTGDLQRMNEMVLGSGASGSPPAVEEEGGGVAAAAVGMTFKVGRYSMEERKQRIDRYRSKRNHRNFTKTIKYACRKTLAESRPRIRGRFARNDDETSPNAATSSPPEEDDGSGNNGLLWRNGFHEEDEEPLTRQTAMKKMMMRSGSIGSFPNTTNSNNNNSSSSIIAPHFQSQYLGFY